jgi:type I restriction enzyme S subunit
MSNWRNQRLGDICQVINGRAYKQSELLNEGKYKVLRVGNFFTNSSWYYSDMELPGDKYCEFKDLLFAWSASFGPRIWKGNKTIYHYHIWKLVANEAILNKVYLYYYLSNKTHSFKSSTHGSIMLHLTKSFMEDLSIIYPKDLHIQSNIAKVLSDLDSKIELNNKINQELEAMAKLLYDYWFVQFNFPDNKGKPYKLSGGKMVYNEVLNWEIPEGWKNGELKDIANITMGQSPPGESYNEEGKGIIFYQGCTDFGNRFPSIRKYTTSPTRFAKQGDILLSVRAPVGTLNIAKENCCIGRGLASLNSKDNCLAYLFGVMVNLKQIFDRRNSAGTTFGSITKDDLFSLKVVKPTSPTLKQFNKILFPVFEKQNTIELENIKLTALRDWLLPMLMNGQVTVREAEEKLGMVAEAGEKYGA